MAKQKSRTKFCHRKYEKWKNNIKADLTATVYMDNLKMCNIQQYCLMGRLRIASPKFTKISEKLSTPCTSFFCTQDTRSRCHLPEGSNSSQPKVRQHQILQCNSTFTHENSFVFYNSGRTDTEGQNWDFTQRMVMISDRPIGTSWSFNMDQIGRPETSCKDLQPYAA